MMGLFGDSPRQAQQTYIRGTGWQDAPDYRPETRASDSQGRKAKYGPSGLKDGGRLPWES